MSMATRTRVKLEKGESSSGAGLGRERGDHGSQLGNGGEILQPSLQNENETRVSRAPRRNRVQNNANTAPDGIMDQTATQRRIIRTGYHSIRNRLMVEKDELIRFSDQKFDNMMNDVDALHSKVSRPREQVADAETVLEVSRALLESLQTLQRKEGPTAADFLHGVIENFGRGPLSVNQDGGTNIDWFALGLKASAIMGEAHGVSTMLGPIDIQPKQRKVAAPRRRNKPADCTRPEQCEEQAGDSQKTETDKNMETMFKVLRVQKRAQLEALVLNRTSFSQTVENIFALSFLVKDGRAEITCGKEGHVVVPRNAPTPAERSSGDVTNLQFVLRFDYNDWKYMQEKFEGEELMPDRKQLPKSVILTPIRKTSRNRARGSNMAETLEQDEDDAGLSFETRKKGRNLDYSPEELQS